MALKKTFYRRKKVKRKYSFLDRMNYYTNKANHGKTLKVHDYAYGYLDGMRGIEESCE